MVGLGILGGTFDPVHYGHIQLAQAALDNLGLRQIVFVPAADPPHKQNQAITPAQHRVAMLKLALVNKPAFSVSLVDVDRPGPHYSIEMIALLQQTYQLGPAQSFFIVGADSLIDLPTWHKPEVLLGLCRLVVAHRPGYQPDVAHLAKQLPGLRTSLLWLEMPETPLSATTVRQKLELGQALTNDVPPSVWAYIQDHQLY